MAGVRTKPQPSGKYQAWFIDMDGRRKFRVGTAQGLKPYA